MRNALIQSVFNMVFRISPDRRKLIRTECEQNVKTEALVRSLCKAVQEATVGNVSKQFSALAWTLLLLISKACSSSEIKVRVEYALLTYGNMPVQPRLRVKILLRFKYENIV